MVTSIILINAERSKINEIAEQLAAINGISEVYSVRRRKKIKVATRRIILV